MILAKEQIKKILSELAKERTVFYSEADFQHALAWKIHKKNSEIKVRLEKIETIDKKNNYIDIMLELKKEKLAIELKYKTKDVGLIKHNEEEFTLKNQGAQDCGRYDFLKDIVRLEKLNLEKRIPGYAIFLTNDSYYWNTPKSSKQHIDKEFHLYEKKILKGIMSWSKDAGIGTTKNRIDEIKLNGKYELNWNEFSKLKETDKNNLFKYTIIEIN